MIPGYIRVEDLQRLLSLYNDYIMESVEEWPNNVPVLNFEEFIVKYHQQIIIKSIPNASTKSD